MAKTTEGIWRKFLTEEEVAEIQALDRAIEHHKAQAQEHAKSRQRVAVKATNRARAHGLKLLAQQHETVPSDPDEDVVVVDTTEVAE